LLLLVENANRMFEAQVGALLEPFDLTIELMKLVYVIDDLEGGTIAAVQAAAGSEPENVAAGVRALQLRGLVTRPRPKEDPETIAIRLTTQGRMKARRAHNAIERLQERAGGWLGAQRDPLLAALARLALLPALPGDRDK
jgi:DNA-binding MarR family transcriptional regulator